MRSVSTPQIGKLKIEWLCLATAEMTAVLRGKHLAVAITEALRSNKLVVAKSGRDNIIKQQTLKTVEKIKEKPWSALTDVEIMCDYINGPWLSATASLLFRSMLFIGQQAPFPLVLGHCNQQLFGVLKQFRRRVKHGSDNLALRNGTLQSKGLQ